MVLMSTCQHTSSAIRQPVQQQHYGIACIAAHRDTECAGVLRSTYVARVRVLALLQALWLVAVGARGTLVFEYNNRLDSDINIKRSLFSRQLPILALARHRFVYYAELS